MAFSKHYRLQGQFWNKKNQDSSPENKQFLKAFFIEGNSSGIQKWFSLLLENVDELTSLNQWVY